MLLTGCRLVLPDRSGVAGWLRISAGRIQSVGEGVAPAPEGTEEIWDSGGRIVAPGFIDQHVHGGGGGSYTDGDQAAACKASAYHVQYGTTRGLASLVTAAVPELLSAIPSLADLAEQGLLEGIHLEGSFLSPTRCGAHDPRYLLNPDPEVLRQLLRAGRGKVRMVTVVPELPGALELIRDIAGAGAVAALGHSDANYAQAMAGVDAGARVVTHLYNGMRPFHHREPGLVGAVLEREEMTCEVIADPHHLNPAAVALAFRAVKGHVALISDATSAAGAAAGIYGIGPARIRAENGAVYLEGTATIAGSTITMADAVQHAVRDAGVPLELVSRAASMVPAHLLGLDRETGSIEVGKLADLVVLDEALVPVAVAVVGAWQAVAADGITLASDVSVGEARA